MCSVKLKKVAIFTQYVHLNHKNSECCWSEQPCTLRKELIRACIHHDHYQALRVRCWTEASAISLEPLLSFDALEFSNYIPPSGKLSSPTSIASSPSTSNHVVLVAHRFSDLCVTCLASKRPLLFRNLSYDIFHSNSFLVYEARVLSLSVISILLPSIARWVHLGFPSRRLVMRQVSAPLSHLRAERSCRIRLFFSSKLGLQSTNVPEKAFYRSMSPLCSTNLH